MKLPLLARPAIAVLLLAVIPLSANSAESTAAERAAIESLRAKFAKTSYHGSKAPTSGELGKTAALLSENGRFTDLTDEESEVFQKDLKLPYSVPQNHVARPLGLAFDRIWVLSETLRRKGRPLSLEDSKLQMRLFRALVYYGGLERKRPNVGARFHGSCFAIPTAAVNIYFCFFPEMNAIEAGTGGKDSLAAQAHETLMALGYQTWTVPARNDATDANPVSVERFRKHVWWVGGNGLAYRPVFAVGVMRSSAAMLDVVSQVAAGAMSATSFSTVNASFWSEGMTVDGAGWGHGRQNQVFGYPRDGTSAALGQLEQFKGTPWEKPLNPAQIDWLFNYLRGSSWFYYKGFLPPVLSRGNMTYGALDCGALPSKSIGLSLLAGWRAQLNPAQIAELETLTTLSGEAGAMPESVERSNYRGVRYFWNQDALAVKSDTHYLLVNMASSRKDGMESAAKFAAEWNFFTDDGHTLFYRDGREYSEAIGAWNLTALPGVTARQGENQLVPITNWRGYSSICNYAGGVARGDNGCAGFIFEKQNGARRADVNDKSGANDPNRIIYGVKAHKAWFVAGNSMLALGTGIDDLKPELQGSVWTTINQTSWRTAVSARDSDGHVLQAGAPDGKSTQWTLLEKAGKETPSISQDGFTYVVFPEYTTGQVKASLERRPTKWNKLSLANKEKKAPAQADVFQLWIDHGVHPHAASYAYLVSADGNATDLGTHLPLTVLTNTEAVQAARSADGRITQAIVYQAPASLKAPGGHTVSVDAPSVIMIEQSAAGEEWTVTVNDPEQLATKKALRLTTDAPLTGDGVANAADGRSMLTIPLPVEPLLGKPITMQVRLRK